MRTDRDPEDDVGENAVPEPEGVGWPAPPWFIAVCGAVLLGLLALLVQMPLEYFWF